MSPTKDDSRPPRRRSRVQTSRRWLRALYALGLAGVVLTGGGIINSTREEDRVPELAGDSDPASGSEIPECESGELTDEADAVIQDIVQGQELQYPNIDGSTFGNREGLLPEEDPGYYREYTVSTPGLDHRGQRRIVTGGDTTQDGSTDPQVWYWTGDHYESFCEFAA